MTKLHEREKILMNHETFLNRNYTVNICNEGLRDHNGIGICIGQTDVGECIGYLTQDTTKIPIPGEVRYRGYNLKTLIKTIEDQDTFGFESVVFLLLFGELPTDAQKNSFCKYLQECRNLPKDFFSHFSECYTTNIMNTMARCILDSYAYDITPEGRGIHNIIRQCIEMIARFPIFASYGYTGKYNYPTNENGLATAPFFLQSIGKYNYTPMEAKILDLLLIIHAEFGGCNSSFAVRTLSSADVDTYSALCTGVCSLKGFRHGGANMKVVEMINEIKINVKDRTNESEISNYLKKIIRKQAFDKTGKIYGVGHAVFTISDPRCILLKQYAQQLAKRQGREEEFHLYCLIEELSPYLIQEEHPSVSHICANVDFYSGFIYNMLNIPKELFTPLFAIARVAGRSAHRIEEVLFGTKIYHPTYQSISQNRTI